MDLDPFLSARTRAAPASATRRRRPLSISPPAPTRDPGISARRAGAGAARPQVRVGPDWGSKDAARGPRVLAVARAGSGLGAGPRNPERSARLWQRRQEPPASGLSRLQEPLRLRCSRGEKKGGKTSCPRVCMQGAAWGYCRGSGRCWKGVGPPAPAAPDWARQRARPSQGHLPLRGPGPRPGWGPRNSGGLVPGVAARSALWGDLRRCAARRQVGVSAPSRPQTSHLGTRFLHWIPSNFGGRRA